MRIGQYHPALGHALMQRNGSELFRESFRRLLENQDEEDEDPKIKYFDTIISLSRCTHI